MRRPLSLIGLLVLALSIPAAAGPADAYDKTSDPKKIGWMDRGMSAVKKQLKDGESAQFRSVFFHQGRDGVPMTCGEVNAKNSFGAYGGFQRFASAGTADLTFFEEQMADFQALWARFCQ